MPTPKATIVSFETPIRLGQPSKAIAKVTQGTPQQFRWQWLSKGIWHTGATNTATDLDHSFNRPNPPWDNVFPLVTGGFPIRLQTLVGGQVVDQTGTLRTIMVVAAPVPPEPIPPEPIPPQPQPPGTVKTVHPDGHVWRKADVTAWRWKGVSAFQLCDRWVRGEDISAFLSAYQGYNTLRVWSYTEGPNWVDPPWNSPTPQQAVDFVAHLNSLGWYVEWTLLTSSNKARQTDAMAQIWAFKDANLSGLFLEGANEPEVQHDGIVIDTEPLKSALQQSGYPYCNGYYINTNKHWGTYLNTHTKRDPEWVRRSHDALDIYNPPADAPPGTIPKHMPIILDEPAKLEDVGGDRVSDWKAYFGSSSFFGGGATFHAQTAKFAQLPTAQEAQLAGMALVGLNAFPVEAPRGPYSRVADNTLRTYIVGNCMVRMRPTTLQAPQPGWTMIDSAGILWRR